MKLTDNEIRDITKLLEAGKPLPDKFRFLLFEDKREVELVWNGKSGEVSNIVLPFQVIAGGRAACGENDAATVRYVRHRCARTPAQGLDE